MSWLNEDMETTNMKIRKILTINGNFHPRSNIKKDCTSKKCGLG